MNDFFAQSGVSPLKDIETGKRIAGDISPSARASREVPRVIAEIKNKDSGRAFPSRWVSAARWCRSC